MTPKLTLPTLTAAALFLATPCLFAQQTGTAHPESLNDAIVDPPPAPPQHYVKPSPAVPMTPAPDATPAAPVLQTRVVEPATPAPATPVAAEPAPAAVPVPDDPTSGVVMEVPSGPNELPAGTVLHATLSTALSTRDTQVESRFTAVLSADVLKHGRVMLPAGTQINGRVTQVRAGKPLGAAAAIRLQPDIVKLPNGMAYELEAEVIDLDHFTAAHVNREGTIVANANAKRNAITFGAPIGTGAMVGAIAGGGVGAVVGASVGAGVGTVLWLRQDRQQTYPEGTGIVFSLDRNLDLTPPTR